MWNKLGKHWQRAWSFFWHDDSLASWLANIVIAFILIRFVVYPLLGLVLGTGYPIVAVVSESMEHKLYNGVICGQQYDELKESFDNYWRVCGAWYEAKGINAHQFKRFSFRNGFDKGDVIILWRANRNNLKVGDILIFQGGKPQPIIHRIVEINQEEGQYYYHTKGDHNSDSIQGLMGETSIGEERILGKGLIRVPYLGWLKILFVDAVKPLGISIQR